jgi:hypothetical protein
MVKNDVTIDQHVARIEHERRHPDERVVGPDLLSIAKDRPGPVRKWQVVKRERDADPANEGRVILADENHGWSPAVHIPEHGELPIVKGSDGNRLSSTEYP